MMINAAKNDLRMFNITSPFLFFIGLTLIIKLDKKEYTLCFFLCQGKRRAALMSIITSTGFTKKSGRGTIDLRTPVLAVNLKFTLVFPITLYQHL